MAEPRRYRLDDQGKRRLVYVCDGVEGYFVHFTQSCSGCYETEDGHPVGDYPYDEKAECHVGAGCSECGYTGKRRDEFFVPFNPKDEKRLLKEEKRCA